MSPSLLRTVAVALLLLVTAGCVKNLEPPTLPGEKELEPERLIIFVHGYLRGAEPMMPMVNALTREGVPRAWVEPGAPPGRVRYHGHLFDFYRYTRAASDHNTPVEALAESLSQFYHSLPEGCPICRRWAHRPVEVTFVAHSFGGVLTREFLLREAERAHLLEQDIPGNTSRPLPWRVTRFISTGTPYFGSVRTRLSRGALSLFLNGLVRTLVMGFVRPEQGGVFGNVIDAQARALRFGSLYLWNAHHRWAALVERLRKDRQPQIPWLIVASVGYPMPELQGDNTTRVTSANVAPLLPDSPVETLVVDLPHTELVRHPEEGRRGREADLVNRAIARFVRAGTLRDDPSASFGRYAVLPTPKGDQLVLEQDLPRFVLDGATQKATIKREAATIKREAAAPDRKAATPDRKAATPDRKAATPDRKAATPDRKAATPDRKAAMSHQNAGETRAGASPRKRGRGRGAALADPATTAVRDAVRQWLFLPLPPPGDDLAREDSEHRRWRLERVLQSDTGDIWLRFYVGVAGRPGEVPQVLSLSPPLSFFQNGVEPSRNWVDLVTTEEPNADGDVIPIMHAMAPIRSHLITIPDLTPTGPYRLRVRLHRVGWLRPDFIRVRAEGRGPIDPGIDDGRGTRLEVEPHQANLIHIYLDGDAIRKAYPEIDRIELREVTLTPERAARRPVGFPAVRNRRRALR